MQSFMVNEFRWLRTTDHKMKEFSNWSRPYEYAFALDRIKSLSLVNPAIHNTCCGYSSLHMDFAKMLNELSTRTVHSDFKPYVMVGDDIQTAPSFGRNSFGIDVEQYDIEQPNVNRFDVVVCISALEDIVYVRGQNTIGKVMDNLLEQLVPGGRLLITCDYPGIDIQTLEDILKQPFDHTGPILTDTYCNIIAMDITKA